jgi:hypothetical protein
VFTERNDVLDLGDPSMSKIDKARQEHLSLFANP